MAPSKAGRNNHEDKDGPVKEKNGGHTSIKMRRGASQQSHQAAQNRDPPPAPTSAPSQALEVQAPSIPWTSFERRALHNYVREHDLTTPASYSSSYHNWVLSRPSSVGLYSPTMVRKQKANRQSKDQLALAVRKHFNGLGIQENDAIVDFIYKVRKEKAMKYQGPNKQSIELVD